MSTLKYAWHPPHRPPPAEPSVATRIAMMGPVGKCLEVALDELLAEQDDDGGSDNKKNQVLSATKTGVGGGDDDGDATKSDNHRSGSSGSELCKAKKRKISCKDVANEDCETDRVNTTNDNKSNEETVDGDFSSRLDESMAKSILEAYGKAVTETEFDPVEKKNTINPRMSKLSTTAINTTASGTTAPAAMLSGEIDHYNRVGGQWRIVIKNATIKPRQTSIVDNGLMGRRCRKRRILDWDNNIAEKKRDVVDDCDTTNNLKEREKKSAAISSLASDIDSTGVSDDNVYHIPGTVQILAYDDDT